MKSTVSADHTLDCSGHLCPAPILMTEEKMAAMRKTEVLEVLFTDPAAHADLRAWCRMTANEFLCSRIEGTQTRVLIRKAGA